MQERRNEIKEFIEAGFYMSPKLNSKGWLYLYDENKNHEKVDLTDLDEEERREIYEFARAEARRKRDEIKKLKKRQVQQSGEGGEKTTSTMAKRYTLEALDKSHAQIVRNLTDATGWFADVLHEIGFYATVIAMQHAKVPLDELYDQVAKFRDPREFSEYVKDHLAALLQASEDAKRILELRKEIDILETELALSDMAINKLKAQKQELMLQLYTALASMCEECMMRYNMSWLVAKYGLALSQGGVVSGGGRVDQISGEEEGSSGGGSEITA